MKNKRNIIYRILISIYKYSKIFLLETIKLLHFLLRMLIYEDYINYLKKIEQNNICIKKKLVVLGNGPSLSDVLNQWKENKIFKDADVVAVNYFCHDTVFTEIRPKYYILADPMFFNNCINLNDSINWNDKVNSMYEVLNNDVSWKMFLCVQYLYWKNIDWKTKILNKNIIVVPCHTIGYEGKLRNWFFKRGLAGCVYNTVVIVGEYIGLTLGYKELYLYGFDHNFFDTLNVDENNRLCNASSHFYEGKPTLKPVIHFDDNGKEMHTKLSRFLYETSVIFYGHEVLQEYANYCSAKIYNCTKNSMIDAYERYIEIN